MPLIAKDAVYAALRLCGHVNSAGSVDETRESRYIAVAPSYLTILVREIAAAENSTETPEAVTNEDSVLTISDDSAARVLPFGLAMYFSVIDRDSGLYNHFSDLYYGKLLPSVKAEETAIEDHYGVLADRLMMQP